MGGRERDQRPVLVVKEGPHRGRIYQIVQRRVTIGRSEDQDIVLPGDTRISRRHAIIVHSGGIYKVIDNHSANGTYINGKPTDRVTLSDGDLIQIGGTTFSFHSEYPGEDISSDTFEGEDTAPVSAPDIEQLAPISLSLDVLDMIRELGRGSFGTVYEALVQGNPDFPVAVKILHRELADDPECLKRFEREVRIGKDLRHRNLVRIYYYGISDQGPYSVMEYVHGETLRQRIDRDGSLPMEEALQVAVDLCDVLVYIHERGIIHRDLKPGNMKFLADGTLKLMDFGIARMEEVAFTRFGTKIGTPYYMSPEQAQGLPADARSDIYALGVVLYEMLTKQVPFTGPLVEVLNQHIHKEPVPLRNLSPYLPASVDAIVGRSLRKRREERYKSAQEMRHDLLVELERLSSSEGSRSERISFALRLVGEERIIQLASDGEISIGRARTNRVAIVSDESVSRRHARILCVGGRYVIEDIGSRNGTFLNGRRVKRQQLRIGDLVEVGYTKFRFVRLTAH